MGRLSLPVKALPRDLYQRYNDSLIKYRGYVYHCTVDREDPIFTLSDIGDPSSPFELDPYDPQIDVRPIQLGYVTTSGGCKYISRAPDRQYKQGLDLYFISGSVLIRNNRTMVNAMLQGNYPTLDQAIDLINMGSYREVAITRHVKIVSDVLASKKLMVYCKEQPIGHIPDKYNDTQIVVEKPSWIFRPFLTKLNWRNHDDL